MTLKEDWEWGDAAFEVHKYKNIHDSEAENTDLFLKNMLALYEKYTLTRYI